MVCGLRKELPEHICITDFLLRLPTNQPTAHPRSHRQWALYPLLLLASSIEAKCQQTQNISQKVVVVGGGIRHPLQIVTECVVGVPFLLR